MASRFGIRQPTLSRPFILLPMKDVDIVATFLSIPRKVIIPFKQIVIVCQMPINVCQTTVCPLIKSMLSNSQTLRLCFATGENNEE
jgi:hypothetical protein